MGDGDDVLGFAAVLRQAGSDGTLIFWGRDKRESDPLIAIPADHWREFSIDWMEIFIIGPPSGQIKGFKANNFPIGSRTLTHRTAYFDLHVDAKALSLIWIPILEGARIAYQSTQGTHKAIWEKVREDRGHGSVIEKYAQDICQYTSIPVFGVRQHMNHHEEISKVVFNNGDVDVRHGAAFHLNAPSTPLFDQLRIRRADLQKAIVELKLH